MHFPETADKLEKIWLQIWNPYKNTKIARILFLDFILDRELYKEIGEKKTIFSEFSSKLT